jgi:hypothetical protein
MIFGFDHVLYNISVALHRLSKIHETEFDAATVLDEIFPQNSRHVLDRNL